MSKNTGNTLVALATGAVIGAGLALLYAPQSGEKTRKQLAKEAKNAKKALEDKYEETSSQLSDFAQKTKEQLEKKLESTFSKAKTKTDEVLASMESELAALKKKNDELLKDLKAKK